MLMTAIQSDPIAVFAQNVSEESNFSSSMAERIGILL